MKEITRGKRLLKGVINAVFNQRYPLEVCRRQPPILFRELPQTDIKNRMLQSADVAQAFEINKTIQTPNDDPTKAPRNKQQTGNIYFADTR